MKKATYLLPLTLLSLVACQVSQSAWQAPINNQRIGTFNQNAQNSQNMRPFFGNLHSHTGYSDGILNPEQAYRMAQGNGLDFMAVTEHNHSAAAGDDGIYLTPKLYEDLKNTARQMTQNGKFVAMYGQEVSTISKGNHVNVFEADTIVDIPHGDFKRLYEQWLPNHPEVAFVQFNHPNFKRDLGLSEDEPPFAAQEEQLHMNAVLRLNPFEAQGSKKFNDYGYDDYGRNFAAMAQAANPYVKTIEILNGPGTKPKPLPKVEAYHEDDYFFYLNQGFRLGPTADQDNHFAHWGSLSPARTGIWAPALTKDELYKALKVRRIFATEDKNLSVLMQANGHYMGEEFKTGAQVTFDVQVADADEAQAPHMIQIYADQVGGEPAKPIHQQMLQPGQKGLQFQWQRQSAAPVYAFVKVIQTNADGSFDEAWTAPVFLD